MAARSFLFAVIMSPLITSRAFLVKSAAGAGAAAAANAAREPCCRNVTPLYSQSDPRQWLKVAVGRPSPVLSFPIHGVTVSPEGFRVLLTNPTRDRVAPVVVSTADTEKVQSPEVLTIMQLMSGIDMATPIFPLETITNAFDSPDAMLAEVRVAPAFSVVAAAAALFIEAEGEVPQSDGTEESEADPAVEQGKRTGEPSDTTLASNAPKMLAALRNLIPGPMDAGVVVELMRQHCDEDGALSREGFSAILLALREGGGSAEARAKEEKLKATWTLISQAGKKVKVAPFIGFACVARYRCPLVVQTGLFDEGNGISLAADEIGFAYPKMRTVEMLREEAKDRSAWVILDTTGEGLA